VFAYGECLCIPALFDYTHKHNPPPGNLSGLFMPIIREKMFCTSGRLWSKLSEVKVAEVTIRYLGKHGLFVPATTPGTRRDPSLGLWCDKLLRLFALYNQECYRPSCLSPRGSKHHAVHRGTVADRTSTDSLPFEAVNIVGS